MRPRMRSIAAGAGPSIAISFVLAGGMENLSQAPFAIRGARSGIRLGQGALEDTLMAGLRARHLRGDKDPAFVEEHMRRVDLPNIERVLAHSGPADVVVYKADSLRIERVVWTAQGA